MTIWLDDLRGFFPLQDGESIASGARVKSVDFINHTLSYNARTGRLTVEADGATSQIVQARVFIPAAVFDDFSRSGSVWTADSVGELYADNVLLQTGDIIVSDVLWTETRRHIGTVTTAGAVATAAVITFQDPPSTFPVLIHVRERGVLMTWRGSSTTIDSAQWLLLPDYRDAAEGTVLTIVGGIPAWTAP